MSDLNCPGCGAPPEHVCSNISTDCRARHVSAFPPPTDDVPGMKWLAAAANPKQAFGDNKVPLHLFPATAIAVGCLSFLEGKGKYGGWNFRAAPIEAMTYVRACDGHMKAYAEGRDIDPDSGLPELGKALACIAILIDATAAGTLIDNRNHNGAGYLKLVKDLEAHVQRLRELHADKSPKHWTIADNTEDSRNG